MRRMFVRLSSTHVDKGAGVQPILVRSYVLRKCAVGTELSASAYIAKLANARETGKPIHRVHGRSYLACAQFTSNHKGP